MKQMNASHYNYVTESLLDTSDFLNAAVNKTHSKAVRGRSSDLNRAIN